MTLTAQQRQDFEEYYPDSIRRMHDLPPGIDLDRRIEGQREAKRLAFREKFSITKMKSFYFKLGQVLRSRVLIAQQKQLLHSPLS